MAQLATRPMGIGALANANNVFKRKFRWTLAFAVNCFGGQYTIGESFVKTAARPKMTIEETAIDYLNAKMYIPGKGVWETMTVTYYDVANDALKDLWLWLNAVYQIIEGNGTTPVPPSIMQKHMGSRLGDYTGTGRLTMYDGCGSPVEQWKLFNAWPKSIDFDTLEMSSSDICEVKLELRYSDVQYIPVCWNFTAKNCCNSCDYVNFVETPGGN